VPKTSLTPKDGATIQTADLARGGGREPDDDGAPTVASETEQRERDRAEYRRLAGERTEPEGGAEDEDEGRDATEPGDDDDDPDEAQPQRRPSSQRREAEEDASDRAELELVAEKVLMRDFGDKDVVKRLLKLDTPKLKKMVDQRRKVQRDADRLGNELEEERRKAKAPKAEAKDDEEDQDPFEALAAHFKSTGDDTAAGLLTKAAKKLAGKKPADDDTQRPRSASIEMDPDVRNAVILTKLREPLDLLAKTYPKLKSDGERLKLVERADRLLQGGVFEPDEAKDPVLMLERAAAVQYPGAKQDAQRRRQKAYDAEADGQPEAPVDNGERETGALTEAQRDRKAFRMLRGGMSPAKVQRRLQAG
jgi:hypothetical protein